MSLKDLRILPRAILSNLQQQQQQGGGELLLVGEGNHKSRIIRSRLRGNKKAGQELERFGVEDLLQLYDPQRDDDGSWEMSILGVCLKLNSEEMNGHLYEESEFARHFVECIMETSWLTDRQKLHLSTNLIPLLLLIICSRSSREFEKDARSFFQDQDDLHESEGFVFIREYRLDLIETLRDPQVKGGCFQQLVFFSGRLKELLEEDNKLRLGRMIRQLQPPCYLNPLLKNRMVLLLTLPNAWRFHGILSQYFLCRGERSLKGWMELQRGGASGGALQGNEWAELLDGCSLPSLGRTDKIIGSGGTHRVFGGEVWGNLKKNNKITNRRPEWLLLQMLTFLQPNWQRLWVYMGFDRSWRLLERLCRLKQLEWEPRVDDLIKLFFVQH